MAIERRLIEEALSELSSAKTQLLPTDGAIIAAHIEMAAALLNAALLADDVTRKGQTP